MDSSNVRLAFTGTGYIAQVHARAAIHNGAELAAVQNHRAESMQAFAQSFGIPRTYTHLDELLDAGGFDALVINTPNALHAPQAIAALRRGIHVMVEKPMAMNAAEARAMLDASEQSGALLMVAHCWRFDEDIRWLKDRLDQLGRIIRTRAIGMHTHWGPSGWFSDPRLSGGGALADMGIHALDITRFLLGDPKPARVYAQVGAYYRPIEVDDTGVIMVHWDSGAVSMIESGWYQPHADGPVGYTQVYGDRGYGQLFPTHLVVPHPSGKGRQTLEPGTPFPRQDHASPGMYNRQMAHFLDCIRTGSRPEPGGLEGLENMRVLDAAYESARTGKAVAL